MRRIDTLKRLRRQRSYAQHKLDAGLARHKLTLEELRYLAALDKDLLGGLYRGLNDKVAELEQEIERYGEEWAKDDWPHAKRARVGAVGPLDTTGPYPESMRPD